MAYRSTPARDITAPPNLAICRFVDNRGQTCPTADRRPAPSWSPVVTEKVTGSARRTDSPR